MGMRGEQFACQWPRRDEVAIEHKNAQVKFLRFEISRTSVCRFCREINGTLIVDLIDVDSDQRGRQRHRGRIALQRLGENLYRLVEHSGLAVSQSQVERQGLVVGGKSVV